MSLIRLEGCHSLQSQYLLFYQEAHLFQRVFPIDLNTRARTKIEEDALIAHKSIGCKGLTRSDFIVPYDKPDQPIILEINTLPGLTSHSLVPKIALNSGISYKELISRIISEAID